MNCTSADGTSIAITRADSGPPVVLADGVCPTVPWAQPRPGRRTGQQLHRIHLRPAKGGEGGGTPPYWRLLVADRQWSWDDAEHWLGEQLSTALPGPGQ